MKIKIDQIEKMRPNDYLLVTWDESYATGILQIDNQHMELVNLTNQLYNACLSGDNTVSSVFKDAMSRMVEYVRFHFTTELKLLEQIQYPKYKEHKMQHDNLVRNILDAAKEYSGGKKFVPNHLVRTLKEWIFSHIAVYDKQYAFFVQEQKKKGLLTDL